MDSSYARGNTEGMAGSSNDDDLFDQLTKDEAVGKGNAKIGQLTTVQLSHHKYHWTAGKVKFEAEEGYYGALAYPCTDVCADYIDNTENHPDSFNCDGTYVYAPLVGLHFDANAGTDSVTGMPDDQTAIHYTGSALEPTGDPHRSGYDFVGWYVDDEATTAYDFSTSGDPRKGTMDKDKVIDVWYVANGEIPDPQVPTDPGQENPPIDSENPTAPGQPGEDLPDPEVPTTDVPKTGDSSLQWLVAAAVSGVGLVWLTIADKKRKSI